VASQAHIAKVLKQEEEQFARTLEQGLKILEQDLVGLQGNRSLVVMSYLNCTTPMVFQWI
jgi:alanyl-tRNA synthetase